MEKKKRGLDRFAWITIITFVPINFSTANGYLFNRNNPAARDALDFYLHILTFCGMAVLVTMAIFRYRRTE
jgi:hypothetical protein